jgi:hypothetical protein
MSIDAVVRRDYQLKNLWDFYFQDDPTIRFKAKSITLPFDKLTAKKLRTGQAFYGGVEWTDPFDIEVYETADFATFAYFKVWLNLVFNPITRTFNSYAPNSIVPYLKTGVFIMNQNNTLVNELPSFTFIIQNIKILGITPITFDYENGDRLSYTITLIADNII